MRAEGEGGPLSKKALRFDKKKVKDGWSVGLHDCAKACGKYAKNTLNPSSR